VKWKFIVGKEQLEKKVQKFSEFLFLPNIGLEMEGERSEKYGNANRMYENAKAKRGEEDDRSRMVSM
jgi:hypothetical protein